MPNDPKVKRDMFDHINQWHGSNLSQKQYCRQNNMPYHIFHYWYRRYRDEHGSSHQSSSFIPVNVQSSTISGPIIEVLLVNGTRLLFHQPVTIDYLKAVIR